MENIKIKGLEDGDLSKFSIKQLGCIEGGKTSGRKNAEDGTVIKAGRASATKQWNENREEGLKKTSMGGKEAVKQKKGVHALNKKDRIKNGQKGYANGLGKLSAEEKSKIGKKAGKASREKNAKLKPEDVLYARKVFIPRHPEFGVVPLSKKFGVTEGTMRGAIKGKSFKDI